MQTSSRLRSAAAIVAVLATLTVAGCGKDNEKPGTGGAATNAADSGAGQSLNVGKSFWHAGWKVDLATATTKAPKSGSGVVVAIEATFNNLGNDSSRFESRLLLSAAGAEEEASPTDSQIPDVPGNAKQTGVLAFRMKAGVKLNEAVLTIGNPANNQAVVPFGATGTLVTQEPRKLTLALSGSVTYPIYSKPGTIAINVTGGELRADVPAGHNEVKKGQLALTLVYSVTYTYGDIYSYYWNDGNLLLQLPDGTSVGVDDIKSVPNIKPGATVSDLTVRFLVKDPAPGQYNLILKNNAAAAPTTAIPFTLS